MKYALYILLFVSIVSSEYDTTILYKSLLTTVNKEFKHKQLAGEIISWQIIPVADYSLCFDSGPNLRNANIINIEDCGGGVIFKVDSSDKVQLFVTTMTKDTTMKTCWQLFYNLSLGSNWFEFKRPIRIKEYFQNNYWSCE
jgi:hypothetical protein